ncbi:MAG: ATP-dependent 6-phosphofructokinase, partial [Gammaproteobacteria bacterium]|nr:ATP-dependent 6-phosphofructokinase [Gammaproteobacteria bacterium]
VLTENLGPSGINALADGLATRADGEVTPVTLRHAQRGGSPVSQDRILATTLGVQAVRSIEQGKNGIMVATAQGDVVEVALEETWQHKKTLGNTLTHCMLTMLNERHHWP